MAEFTTTAGQPWLALADVVRACLIFTVAATFPVQLFVVTDIVEQDYMFKSGRWRTHTLLTSNAFRTSLVFGAVLVAVCESLLCHSLSFCHFAPCLPLARWLIRNAAAALIALMPASRCCLVVRSLRVGHAQFV